MTVTELQALVLKLQSQINQLELTNKGANKALEFRLEAVLQANLDTFWLLICAILVQRIKQKLFFSWFSFFYLMKSIFIKI